MRIKHTNGRFYTKTKHGEAELLYRKEGKVLLIYHTFVPDEDRHQGIAAGLAMAAFGFAIANRLMVRPDCPYIPYFLELHKELQKYVVG